MSSEVLLGLTTTQWTAVGTILLAVVAVVQIWREAWRTRATRRERQRIALNAAFAEYWRLSALHDRYKSLSLVELAKLKALDANELDVNALRSTIGELAELGSASASFGAVAWELLADARRLQILLDKQNDKGMSDLELKRTGDRAVSQLGEAVEVLRDALNAVPSWVKRHSVQYPEPTSRAGIAFVKAFRQQTLAAGASSGTGKRQVRRAIASALSRLAAWLDPTAVR